MRELPGGRFEVLTFKEGLLSKVAHDLCLVLDQCSVQTDGERIEAVFHPASLSVAGVMRGGRLDTDCLSEHDRREILENVRDKILLIDRYPEARFSGVAVGNGS